jgi:hypothetical protein
MVSRHVIEGEGHITKQLLLIDQLRSSDAPSDEAEALLADADALLLQFMDTQTAHVAHLKQIRDDQSAGTRDSDGNLILK